MNPSIRCLLLCAVLGACGTTPPAPAVAPSSQAMAAAPAPTASVAPAPSAEATDRPAPRDRDYPWMSREGWWQRHRALLAIEPSIKRDSELAFLGDSIIEGFDNTVWNEFFARYRPLRLGIGGDKTQQVLFRIEQGELDGLGSKLVVLLIGTNNFGLGDATPESVARGIAAVVKAVQSKLPEARLLLLGILPREEKPDSELRKKVRETNLLVQRLGDGDRVTYLDIGAQFLDAEGKIPAELMADFLHPTPKGYRVFSTALAPKLGELLSR
jgi:lysophospholipase L1-like esterase